MLIHNPKGQVFLRLHELGRLDLTMESVIFEDKWFGLFFHDDREAALKKLQK